MMSSNHSPHDEASESRMLGSLKKPPNAAPPPGYFDAFADRLKERLEEEQLLEEAPLLRSAGKVTPFRVPEGYFSALPARIMALSGLGRQVATIRPLQLSLYATAAAAVILLLFVFKGSDPAAPAFPDMPDLSVEELLAVVDIDEHLIIESMNADDLDRLMADIPIPVRPTPEAAPAEEPMPVSAEDVSFDELLDELDDLDDAALDALEAELMEEDGDWF